MSQKGCPAARHVVLSKDISAFTETAFCDKCEPELNAPFLNRTLAKSMKFRLEHDVLFVLGLYKWLMIYNLAILRIVLQYDP